jgi:hypothetical protein
MSICGVPEERERARGGREGGRGREGESERERDIASQFVSFSVNIALYYEEAY